MLDLQNVDKHKILIGRIAASVINSGDELYKNYEFNNDNKPVFNDLLHYFNESLETQYNIEKSIALIGSVGSGKTTIMRIFQKYLQLTDKEFRNVYRITSMNEILDNMTNGENNDILTYNLTTDVRGGQSKNPLNICINEFGNIEDIKIYGTNAMSIFQNFLMIRYDIFQQYNKKTHITSNLTGKQLEEIFPVVLTDRFKEMFNMVPLNCKSFRK